MRSLCCTGTSCLNAYSPYTDDAPDGVISLCPVCHRSMSVMTLDEMTVQQASLIEQREADAPPAAPPPPLPGTLS